MIIKTDKIILTGPVNSGKTTGLAEWSKERNDIYGFLCPYTKGKRVLLDIQSNQISPLEISDLSIQSDTHPCIQVGRFHFLIEAFNKMRNILTEHSKYAYKWMIIDEIGKLELKEEGLEPALSVYFTTLESSTPVSQRSVLIVRDFLLDEIINKYRLENYFIVNKQFFTLINNTIVVILTGGKSNRMGYDKAALRYHYDKPQYSLLYDFFYAFFSDVYISVRSIPDDGRYKEYPLLIDAPHIPGPAAALSSAIDISTGKNILLIGCDYPMIQDKDILHLLNEAASEESEAVCYLNDEGFEIPVLALYKNTCFNKFREYITEGGESLRHFLKSLHVKAISPDDGCRLESFDTPQQMQNLIHGKN